MKRLAFALTGFMFLSNFSFANSISDAQYLETKKFTQEGELMPPSGDYAGETVENDEKRTLILLDNSQKQIFNIDQSDIAFANFRHNGEFYIATIPAMNVDAGNNLDSVTKLVEKATFVKKHWGAKTRPETASVEVHAEMVLDFYKSAKLNLVYNQDKAKSVKNISLNGLVVSIEAIRSKENRHAGFMPAGLKDSLAVGYRVYSLDERAKNYEKETEAEVSKYTLDFSDTMSYHDGAESSVDYFLYNSILASNDYGRNQTYNLFTNNCTNRLFDLLDLSMGYNKSKNFDINYTSIRENYIDYANNDLKDVLGFLSKYVQANPQVDVPPMLLKMLENNGSELALQKLGDLEVASNAEENPRNFLYSLPMFIEGHLKARGLLK